MNSNPIGGLWLLAFLVLATLAVVDAKERRWKFLNLVIIFTFAIAGIAIGVAFGALGGKIEIGGHLAASLMFVLGTVGAFGCVRRNKRRKKQPAQSSETTTR